MTQAETKSDGAVRKVLKKVPFLVSAKRYLWNLVKQREGVTTLDVLSAFPSFAPNSDGNYKDKAEVTLQTINGTVPALRSLLISLRSRMPEITDVEYVPRSDEDRLACSQLKTYLDKHGSDKAS